MNQSVSRLLPLLAVAATTAAIVGMSMEQSGSVSRTLSFYTSFATVAALLAILSLGLQIQWGYAGVFNFGVVGFFMVGAYTAGIVTKEQDNSDYADYIGGFGPSLDLVPALATDQWLPFVVAVLAAGLVCGVLAFLVAIPTLRLREDYLAITTIGIAELLRRITIEETWLVNGTRVLGSIPQPLSDVVDSGDYKYLYLGLSVGFLALIYFALERSVRSPWGRVLRALREDELSTAASGKNVFAFKTQAFVLGGVIMGMGGAMFAFQNRAISPDTFTHFFGTFLIWTMIIVGGSGNLGGAIVGAYVIRGFLWSVDLVQGYELPELLETRIPFLSDLAIGVLIVGTLLVMPRGLLPEERRVSIWVERRVRRKGSETRAPPAPAEPETDKEEEEA